MAILPKEDRKKEKTVIDLQGPNGNTFYLLGYAESLAKQLKYSDYDRKKLMEEMKSGDYEHLIQVFDEHFGQIIDLQR